MGMGSTAKVPKSWPEVLRQEVQWQIEALRGKAEVGISRVRETKLQRQRAVRVVVSDAMLVGGREWDIYSVAESREFGRSVFLMILVVMSVLDNTKRDEITTFI